MLYPRVTKCGTLISEDQMVGHREHLAMSHRILCLMGIITEDTDCCNLLMAMDSISTEPIKLIITSPGGSLDTTFLLYDTIKMLQSPVYTLGRYCASAAALLLAVGSRRYVTPHAKTMLHLPAAFFGEEVVAVQDLTIRAKETEKYKEEVVRLLQECGMKRSREQALIEIDRPLWLTAQETIDYGLADLIMTPEVMKDWLNNKEGVNEC